jgi:2-keto-4-pentenoate hydratase
MATTGQIEQLATQILARFDTVQTIDTMASDLAQLGIEDAYRIQLALVDQRCARGERIVGRKVAFTSRGTMSQFGVTESAFGSILSGGVFADGEAVPVSRFPAVGAEAEVGFVIGEELKGPGVTIAQALKATTGVVPAIEIINLCITHTPLERPGGHCHQRRTWRHRAWWTDHSSRWTELTLRRDGGRGRW